MASRAASPASVNSDHKYVSAPLSDGKRKFRVTVLISGSGSNLAALMAALPTRLDRCEIVSVISNSKDAYGLERARQHEPHPIPCSSFSPFQYQKSRPDLFKQEELDIKRLSELLNSSTLSKEEQDEIRKQWQDKKRKLASKVKPLYQLELADKVRRTKPDLIVLAGFMLILLPETLEKLKRDWTEDDQGSSGIQAPGTTSTLGQSPYPRPLESGTPIPIINLHPALPGSFVGPHVIEDAWEAFNQMKLPQTKEEWEKVCEQQQGETTMTSGVVDDVADSLASTTLDDKSGALQAQDDASPSSFGPRITETGIMIHRVIPELDRGEPILWRQVPMKRGEWIDDLKTRIHEVEHEAIVEAVKVVTDRLSDGTWWDE
ncbi:Bifunctional purine biosynthetic protein ADE5,7 [Microbotryomycetes sp. JL201]|nr:Bifunctional purine biosynthetic protein ADE5,7 [Microbotryomycetes sp. JL201]